MLYITDKFDLSVVGVDVVLDIYELPNKYVIGALKDGFVSAVRNPSTASWLSAVTGIEVPVSTDPISPSIGDIIALPRMENGEVKWKHIAILSRYVLLEGEKH